MRDAEDPESSRAPAAARRRTRSGARRSPCRAERGSLARPADRHRRRPRRPAPGLSPVRARDPSRSPRSRRTRRPCAAGRAGRPARGAAGDLAASWSACWRSAPGCPSATTPATTGSCSTASPGTRHRRCGWGSWCAQQEDEARNLQRIEQELQVAQLIQQQFLPAELPELDGWQVAAFYRPARTVGGDFYDVDRPGRRPHHGGRRATSPTRACRRRCVMASTHALLRSTATHGVARPGRCCAQVNDLLHPQIPTHMFVTCLVLIIDPAPGGTQFANAGHNLPYLRRGGAVRQLHARGMPLGLMPGSDVRGARDGDRAGRHRPPVQRRHHRAARRAGRDVRLRADRARWWPRDVRAHDLVDRCVAGARRPSPAAVEQEDDITLVALQRGRSAHGRRDLVDVHGAPARRETSGDVMDRVAAVVGDALRGRPARRAADRGVARRP